MKTYCTMAIFYKGYDKNLKKDMFYVIDLEKDEVFSMNKTTLKSLCPSYNFEITKQNPKQIFYI